VPVDLQGRQVVPVESDLPLALTGTVWEAAADASMGVRWAETDGTPACRRTQGRRLVMAAVLFGFEAEPAVRERVATALDVPALTLHDAARRYSELLRWRERAQLLLDLLQRCLSRGLSRIVLAAGCVAGLWGRPSRWDPGGRCLRSLV